MTRGSDVIRAISNRRQTEDRDELEGVLYRLKGLTAFMQLLHQDADGGPYLDDLNAGDRAAVLALAFDLAHRAEQLGNQVLSALPISAAETDRQDRNAA